MTPLPMVVDRNEGVSWTASTSLTRTYYYLANCQVTPFVVRRLADVGICEL